MATVIRPGHGDFQAIEKRLEIFRATSQAHQHNLDELLQYCQSLKDDIRLLKQDKQLRLASEHDNTVSSQGVTTPQVPHNHTDGDTYTDTAYVALIVDGNDYPFQHHFVHADYKGGIAAGEELRNAVLQQVERSEAEQCDVVAAVYADLRSLSKSTNLTATNQNADKLVPFFAGFNGSFATFDFVDAGQNRGSTIAKVKSAFRRYYNDPNCKHVFVAACHNVEYLHMLESLQFPLTRISLIRLSEVDPRFEQLASQLTSRIFEIPNLFQSNQLNHSTIVNGSASTSERNNGWDDTGWHNPDDAGWHDSGESGRSNPPESGWAKSGWHKPALNDGWGAAPTRPEVYSDNHRGPGRPKRLEMAGGSDASGSVSPKSESGSPGKPAMTWRPKAATIYTSETPAGERHNLIPVNKYNQRIDEPISKPPVPVIDAFQAMRPRPCQYYHQSGDCQFGSNCEFSHESFDDPDMAHAMRWMLRTAPCRYGSACRWKMCMRGHVCLRPNCEHSPKPCSMPPKLHKLDLRVAKWDRPRSDLEMKAFVGAQKQFRKAWNDDWDRPISRAQGRTRVRSPNDQSSSWRNEPSPAPSSDPDLIWDDGPPPKQQNSWDQSSWDQSSWDRPTGAQSSWDQPSGEPSSWDQPAGQQSSWDQPSEEQSSWDQPNGNQASWDQTSWDQPPANANNDWEGEQFGGCSSANGAPAQPGSWDVEPSSIQHVIHAATADDWQGSASEVTSPIHDQLSWNEPAKTSSTDQSSTSTHVGAESKPEFTATSASNHLEDPSDLISFSDEEEQERKEIERKKQRKKRERSSARARSGVAGNSKKSANKTSSSRAVNGSREAGGW